MIWEVVGGPKESLLEVYTKKSKRVSHKERIKIVALFQHLQDYYFQKVILATHK